MGPRKVHKLRLGKYMFMREFLNKEWCVVDEERGNVDTIDNASIDAVWDSFQFFLEIHGYSQDFCSKILLGKLLHEAGVEKVKRGPRKRQKFYYFPLKPVSGSRAESIVATNTHARYNTRAFYTNMHKIKPEYFTIHSSSLGRVSVGVLYDRSMTPEKFAARALKKRQAAKENKASNSEITSSVTVPQLQTKVELLAVSDSNIFCNGHYNSAIAVSEAKAPTADPRKQTASGVNCSNPDYNNSQSISMGTPKNEMMGYNSSLTHAEFNGGSDLSEILAQSIARIYDSEGVNEKYQYCQDDMYLSNWQDGFDEAQNALLSSQNMQSASADGFQCAVPSLPDSLPSSVTAQPMQNTQGNVTQQCQSYAALRSHETVSERNQTWESMGNSTYSSFSQQVWQTSSQSNLSSNWPHVTLSSYSVGCQEGVYSSCVLDCPPGNQSDFASDWSISCQKNSAPVCYSSDWVQPSTSAQLHHNAPDYNQHFASDWCVKEAGVSTCSALEVPCPTTVPGQSTSAANDPTSPVRVEKRSIGRPKGSKTNPDKLKAKKQQRNHNGMLVNIQTQNFVLDSVKKINKNEIPPLNGEEKRNAGKGKGTRRERSPSNRGDLGLLNLDARSNAVEIPWKLTVDMKNRFADSNTGKKPRGRPKGSKNKKPSKKALLSNPSVKTMGRMEPFDCNLFGVTDTRTVKEQLPVSSFRSFVSSDFKNWSKKGRKPKRAPKTDYEIEKQDHNKENDPPLSHSLGTNYEQHRNGDLFGVYAAEPVTTHLMSAYPNTSQSSSSQCVQISTGLSPFDQLKEMINNQNATTGRDDGQTPSLVNCHPPTTDGYGFAEWTPFPELQYSYNPVPDEMISLHPNSLH